MAQNCFYRAFLVSLYERFLEHDVRLPTASLATIGRPDSPVAAAGGGGGGSSGGGASGGKPVPAPTAGAGSAADTPDTAAPFSVQRKFETILKYLQESTDMLIAKG